MMFKVEITQDTGDKYIFIANSISAVGGRTVTISGIQDVGLIQQWEDREALRKKPIIIDNPGVKFIPK